MSKDYKDLWEMISKFIVQFSAKMETGINKNA